MMNLLRIAAGQLWRFILELLLLASLTGWATAAVDLPIYTDSQPAGWEDWSWSATTRLANASPVHSGSGAIAVTITSAWGALYLHAKTPVATSGYEKIEFWVHGGASGGQSLKFVVNGSSSYAFTPSANVWTRISIPFSALDYPVSLAECYWQDASGAALPTFSIDDITLIAGSGSVPPTVVGPALSVDASQDRHSISSDIYGINLLPDEALALELRLPLRRWGGNQTSRYNWQNDTLNTGMDWYFENISQDNPNPATLPDGSSADRFVAQNRRTASRSLITMPTLGWVAKRRSNGHPYDCAFRVSKYGAQQATDPWDADCGNGLSANGSKITGNDPTDTSVASSPAFVADWVRHLVGQYGSAAQGGVSYYALDNEPMIWHSTHRDVHPQPPTYDEIRDRGFAYAAAIKAADPTAKILGPVEDGWCRYLYSGADNCLSSGADHLAHGGVPYVAWYLQQMKSYEQQHGLRLLDYLDLHYYPSANGVSLSGSGSAATQALRLRSTRSLFDPAYIDESWISDTAPGGVAVQLIPRMKQWVTDNYPGTKLAISEYNWGAPESMNGALAQADVLGLFGREGLDLATFWGDVIATQPLSFAFRMYRNYDATGHGFGDVAVRSASADQSALAVYAALRSADGALTVMVINKSASPLASVIGLADFKAQAAAQVYRYSPAHLSGIEKAVDQAISASGLSATFPASSITLFEIPAASAPVSVSGSFTGPRSSYRIVKTATGFNVVDKVSGSSTALTGVTSIQFADRRINLLIGDLSKTIAVADLKTLIELYVAFFNRVPDADGLAYWISQVKVGMTLNQIAEAFYQAAIAFSDLTDYSSSMSHADFVRIIYSNVLGRSGAKAPTDAEVQYWASQLGSGQISRGDVLRSMLNSAHAYAGDATWGWVSQLLDNKITVATRFAIEQGLNDNTPQESISKGMAIAAAVTATSTAAAISLIGVTDTGFNLALP